MRTTTPLRYPGGKAVLAGAFERLLDANKLAGPAFAEPYAGAAGASIELLLRERVPRIYINDLDYRVYCFWWAVLNRTEEFIALVRTVPLSIPEWKSQRDVYRAPRSHPRLRVGFAMFFLNRTNRSGIVVNGGPIGGLKQKSEWGIDARFSRPALAHRIERIAAYRERISVSNEDALVFARRLDRELKGEEHFLYLDPPYYAQGARLYLSRYTDKDHGQVARFLTNRESPHWALTYDNVSAIRRLYEECRIRKWHVRYTAQERRTASELFIASRELDLPRGLLTAV